MDRAATVAFLFLVGMTGAGAASWGKCVGFRRAEGGGSRSDDRRCWLRSAPRLPARLKDAHVLFIYQPGGYGHYVHRELSYSKEQRDRPEIRKQLREESDFNLVE